MSISNFIGKVEQFDFIQHLRNQGYEFSSFTDFESRNLRGTFKIDLKKSSKALSYKISLLGEGSELDESYWFGHSIYYYLGHREEAELFRQASRNTFKVDYALDYYVTIQSRGKLDQDGVATFERRKLQTTDLKLIDEKINILIESEVFPFFDRYESLGEVYKTMESLPIEKLADFLPGATPLKRLIIKRLCNDPDFENYGNRLLEHLKHKSQEDPFNYRTNALIAPELFQLLKNTFPHYNL